MALYLGCEVADDEEPIGVTEPSEAVEGAIKLARYATGRQYVVAMIGSFHGRSYGSVSLTASKAKYHAGFGPLLPGVVHTHFGDFEHLEQVVFARLIPPEEVAAIVVEPVLGEGGYVFPPEGWFGYLRDICDRHGIVLVAAKPEFDGFASTLRGRAAGLRLPGDA